MWLFVAVYQPRDLLVTLPFMTLQRIMHECPSLVFISTKSGDRGRNRGNGVLMCKLKDARLPLNWVYTVTADVHGRWLFGWIQKQTPHNMSVAPGFNRCRRRKGCGTHIYQNKVNVPQCLEKLKTDIRPVLTEVACRHHPCHKKTCTSLKTNQDGGQFNDFITRFFFFNSY